MQDNKDVGMILTRHSGKQKDFIAEPYFSRDLITNKFRIVGLSALYRTAYLKRILRKHENPWEFEKFASIRSKRYKYRVLQYNNQYPSIFVYYDEIEKGFGITLRKWLPKNKELFDKYNISVNFDNLGMMDPKTYNGLLTYNPNMPKPKEKVKGIKENLYILKKRVFKIPNRIKKSIRKVKSLI